MQHLDLEAVVGHAQAAGGGDRRRERAHVVAAEGRPHHVDALEHEARQALERDVGVGLVGEDRRGPALLAGEHRLVVPVGALDEPHRERPAAAAAPVDQRPEVVAGVAQVGLHDHAGLVEGAELFFVEQFGEHRVGEVAVAELLEVEIDEGAVLRRAAHDRAQRVFDGGRRTAKIERVDLRVQRGDLDRDVDARQGPPGRVFDRRLGGPGGGLAGEVVEQVEVALLVGGRFAGADRGLAEHVDGEAQAAVAQLFEAGQRGVPVGAQNEAARE